MTTTDRVTRILANRRAGVYSHETALREIVALGYTSQEAAHVLANDSVVAIPDTETLSLGLEDQS